MDAEFTPRTVLFDLDGTLADTGPDLAGALNTVLEEQGRDALPYADIRPTVSHGALAMVCHGFGLSAEDPAALPLRDRVVEWYAAHIAERTTLFPGMEPVLALLAERRIPWGIVTNKTGRLTDTLLAQMPWAAAACCVVSGDTLPRKKPHPAPLLHACAQAGHAPESCLYLGDAERDIEAGRRAGMRTGAALFGYLSAEDRPEHWGADYLFASPAELHAWLGDVTFHSRDFS